MLCSWLVLALVAAAQGRAVNISNTWVLPEEGFPVFYRYFRDRISWYEADAVCQFHHANLVTVDTTAQYDAVRAYLKELDISSAVWVGLIRSNPDGDFTWTDYRGLSGDGYWSSAPDARSAPLCAASDPAADYRWEARACGGPSVASFICELPVPQWALGNEGCMVRALPALTVLYLPESAAVQLTADCGMAGVKRVQCTGNVKHEDLIRDLSCTEDDESSPPTSISSTITTWVTTDSDLETSDAVIEDNITTEHEDGIFTLNSVTSTPNLLKFVSVAEKNPSVIQHTARNRGDTIVFNKNINLDIAAHNNLQNNDVPKMVNHNDFYSNEQLEKEEYEKHMQHKLLHNELARLGNYENIFSQPTDHFVPPLIMAKAKVNDDMTAISFEEKLAQHEHSEYQHTKYENENNNTSNKKFNHDNVKPTAEVSTVLFTTEIPITKATDLVKDKKEINKNVLPKKYNQTSVDVKGKLRGQLTQSVKPIRSVTPSTQTETIKMEIEGTTLKSIVYFDSSNEDSSLDLTVIIKDPVSSDDEESKTLNVSNTVNIINETYNSSIDKTPNNLSTTQATIIYNESSTESTVMQNVTLNDEIIKITLIQDGDYAPINSTVFEITTRTPIFKDNNENSFHPISLHSNSSTVSTVITPAGYSSTDEFATPSRVEINSMANITDIDTNKTNGEFSNTHMITQQNLNENTNGIELNINSTEITPQLIIKETIHNITESESLDYFEKKYNNTSEDEDDFQSPLLSGANEPLHRPNRLRRPQQPNKAKKFNPFRILG